MWHISIWKAAPRIALLAMRCPWMKTTLASSNLSIFTKLKSSNRSVNAPSPYLFAICKSLKCWSSFQQFFKQFGFVVIRDVLSKEECDATEKDVWQYLESRCWDPSLQRLFPEMAKKLRIIRHDPHTWQNDGWAPMREEGILGGPWPFPRLLSTTGRTQMCTRWKAHLCWCIWRIWW